jgi:hypothetical protein
MRAHYVIDSVAHTLCPWGFKLQIQDLRSGPGEVGGSLLTDYYRLTLGDKMGIIPVALDWQSELL